MTNQKVEKSKRKCRGGCKEKINCFTLDGSHPDNCFFDCKKCGRPFPKPQEEKCCEKCVETKQEGCRFKSGLKPFCPCHSKERKELCDFLEKTSLVPPSKEKVHTNKKEEKCEEVMPKCDENCPKGNHGHCINCGLLTQPIMKCKCPERQNGDWVKEEPKIKVLIDDLEKAINLEQEPTESWKNHIPFQRVDNQSGVGSVDVYLLISFIEKLSTQRYEEGKREVVEKIRQKLIEHAKQNTYEGDESAVYKTTMAEVISLLSNKK